jgi:hypothetical protein
MIRIATFLLASALLAPAADQGLLRLAMPDARVVAGINVAQSLSSPLGQFILTKAPESGRGLNDLVLATGFDPRQNLQEVLFASPGGNRDASKLIIARGTFDIARITGLVKTTGAIVNNFQGVDVISAPPHPENSSQGQPGALAFLDPTLAVAGDPDSVRDAISRRNSAAGLNPDLVQRIAELSASQDAWFVSLVPAAELAGRLPQAAGTTGALPQNTLRAISQASGGVKLGDPVSAMLQVVAGTVQDASSLADVIRFLTGMLQMGKSDAQAPLRQIMSGLDVKPSGTAVNVSLAVPLQQLEALIQQAKPQ